MVKRITVSRTELLTTLEGIQAGLRVKEAAGSEKGLVDQGDCFALRRGKLYSTNGEICLRGPSGFPAEWKAAVPGLPFLHTVQKMADAELEVELTDSELIFYGRRD